MCLVSDPPRWSQKNLRRTSGYARPRSSHAKTNFPGRKKLEVYFSFNVSLGVGDQPLVFVFQKQRVKIHRKQIDGKCAYYGHRLHFATKNTIKWLNIWGALPT